MTSYIRYESNGHNRAHFDEDNSKYNTKSKESTTSYIRYESDTPNIVSMDEDDSEFNEIKYHEYNELDETADMERRCKIYMKGYRCHKGDYCERLHRLPREDRVLCKYFKEGQCRREADNCWFFHPHIKVNKFKPDDDAPLLVQAVGHTM